MAAHLRRLLLWLYGRFVVGKKEYRKGAFSRARFCPRCGVESLTPDDARPGQFWEFVCTACGLGFALHASRRWYQAIELARRDRKIRLPGSDPTRRY